MLLLKMAQRRARYRLLLHLKSRLLLLSRFGLGPTVTISKLTLIVLYDIQGQVTIKTVQALIRLLTYSEAV